MRLPVPIALLLLVTTSLVFGQELQLRLPERELWALGETVEAELVIDSESPSLLLGSLPQLAGASLRVTGPEFEKGRALYRLGVTPWRTGELTIPAFSVDDGEQSFRSRPVTLRVAKLPVAAEHLGVAFSISTERCYVGEEVELILELDLDVAFFRKNALQVFGRHVDLPLILRSPALESLPGGAKAWEQAGASTTLVLNGELVRALRLGPEPAEGRARVQLRRRFRPTESAFLRLGGIVAEFDFATEFDVDFFGNPEPRDRRRGRVYSEAVVLEVLKPGASLDGEPGLVLIGPIEVTTSISTTSPALEAPFLVEVLLRRDGGVIADPVPPFDFPGVHVFARREIESKDRSERRFQLEVAIVDPTLRAFPALAIAFFDPETGRVSSARSRPLPVDLVLDDEEKAGRGESRPVASVDPGAVDDYGIRPQAGVDLEARRARPWSTGQLLLIFGWPPLLVFGLAWYRERRAWERREPALARARRAHARFRAGLKRGDSKLELYTGYLSARALMPPSSLFRRELRARLAPLELPADLVEDAVAMMDLLVASDFGGADRRPADGELVRLVESIEAHLRSRRATR